MEGIDCNGVRCRTSGRVAVIMLIFLIGVGVFPSAIGAVEHPSVEESATGLRGIVSDLWPLGKTGAPSVFVEISDIRLYNIPGFHTPGIRAGCRLGTVSVCGEVGRVVSGVGTETRCALSPAVHGGDKWAVSVSVVYESVTIDGFRTDRKTGVTARSRLWLTETVAAGGEVRDVWISGASDNGADLSTSLIVFPAGPVSIRTVLEIGRRTGMDPLLSATLSGGAGIRMTVGYRGATETMTGVFCVGLAGLACAAGVEIHPVLGYRSGVTLSWRRQADS